MGVTDHCTMFFDTIGGYDFGGCCVIHDDEYEDPNIPRVVADKNLRD